MSKSNVQNVSQERVDEITMRHRELMDELKAAQEAQQWWETLLQEEPVSFWFKEQAQKVEEAKSILETADPKEVVKLQAQIAVRRDMLNSLTTKASLNPVHAINAKLHRFEQENSLLVHASGAANGSGS